MELNFDIDSLRYDGSGRFDIGSSPTRIDPLYDDKEDYQTRLDEFRRETDALQNRMYAHGRYGLLLIFQAMDAAGKDGTISNVMSGINPHGVVVSSFKRPSSEELDHGFLWRTNCAMPGRGKIHIFNRSYYEEVLVAKVHPQLVTESQRLPLEDVHDSSSLLWQQRYEDICNMEKYESRNGIKVVKFFLHLSKEEQRQRFIERIDREEKNWKFSEADIKERGYWDSYQQAYESAINNTSTPYSPWYVIPADDKLNMRLLVSKIVLSHLLQLDMEYPVVSDERKEQLQYFRTLLENE